MKRIIYTVERGGEVERLVGWLDGKFQISPGHARTFFAACIKGKALRPFSPHKVTHAAQQLHASKHACRGVFVKSFAGVYVLGIVRRHSFAFRIRARR